MERLNSHSPMTSGGRAAGGKGAGGWRVWLWWDGEGGPLGEMGGKLRGLFGSKWRTTTMLMWVIWGAMSLGKSSSDAKVVQESKDEELTPRYAFCFRPLVGS
jgi:hypothetical protein